MILLLSALCLISVVLSNLINLKKENFGRRGQGLSVVAQAGLELTFFSCLSLLTADIVGVCLT